MALVRTVTRNKILQKLDRMIMDREPGIYVNLINCGTAGRVIIETLTAAGYVSDAPGCPQQNFILKEDK